jgi:hypothetical protein
MNVLRVIFFFNKSNKLIYTPDDGDGVLGLNNLIGDKFVPGKLSIKKSQIKPKKTYPPKKR